MSAEFEANLAKISFDLIGGVLSDCALSNLFGLNIVTHRFVAYLSHTTYVYRQDAAYAGECAAAGSTLDG